MDTLLVIVLVGGLVAVLYTINRATDTVIQKADRTIRSKTLQAGRNEVATGLEIDAPVGSADLLRRIVEVVNAHELAPALVSGLYLKEREAGEVTFAVGNKLHGDAFVATVALENHSSGCRGAFAVINWTESGAEVHGRKEMARLRSRIDSAVSDSGGRATATT
jgi:hypothetical protein